MKIRSRVTRYGNSLTVRLPVAVARHLDVRAGDDVVLRAVDDGVLIERPVQRRLAARLATVGSVEPEIAVGPPVGAEVFE